jgi:hypothetical protein
MRVTSGSLHEVKYGIIPDATDPVAQSIVKSNNVTLVHT